jgi:importin-5
VLLQGEQWPELLGVLFQASQSPEAGVRETAFRIFATTPGIIEKQHEETVLGVFTKGFRDDNISVSAIILLLIPSGL